MNEEITIPPEGNVFGRIIRVEATRGNVEYYQRAVVVNVLAKMNNTLQDCSVEIALAKAMFDLTGGYRTMGYGRVKGMTREDYSAYMMDVKRKYTEWNKSMQKTPATLAIVKSFCQDEDSIDSIRKKHRISERRALWRLIWGLNEYSILAGWGNQIGEDK